MQEALPHKSWLLFQTNSNTLGPVAGTDGKVKGRESMRKMVSENAVIVFSKQGCCMSYVVKRLFLGHGVNPVIYDVFEEDEVGVSKELEGISGGGGDGKGRRVQFPAVFIGGRLFGGLDRVMAAHITGELVPVLKEAGALWL